MAVFALAFGLSAPVSAATQSTAFKQAIALAAQNDAEVLEFYKARDFRPIWTESSGTSRRRAFIEAAAGAGDHGLPTSRYDANEIKASFASIQSARQRGELEVQTTQKFLQYAQDIQSGILEPSRLSADIDTQAPRRGRIATLEAFLKSNPRAFLKALPPKHPDYARLMKEKARLEKVLGSGGWGDKVPNRKLKLGSNGNSVVALRARLTAMGHKNLGNSPEFDEGLEKAVTQFQIDHGLNPDGVAGGGTIDALNVSAQTRLQQVIIGLERQRWLNFDRGNRHIFVNQADQRAFVMDNGKVTLDTRVVIGKASSRYRTPEFNDEMTHMVVNPTWNVPQSIASREYLPMLQKNPAALVRQGLRMYDASGRQVDSTQIDYSQFTPGQRFPFDLKQPPSSRNALGLVKFMFPNRFNVYLHDTPSKSLFARDGRAFSHGCVRVQKPFDLAYTLLRKQTSDPKGQFHSILDTGRETVVDLVKPVPIYLTYHTAWVTPSGRPNYRDDIYGRDHIVFSELAKAGVVLRAVRG
ncbi:MAG: L,D-transpeptidase family protein [Rhodobacteraceae bacterium]|nr:L,D-transpeptidase family protein [Paracoccaceae bacterium]